MPITVHTLLHEKQLTGFSVPHAVHIGFMKPKDIAAVSDVPQFTEKTKNEQIANNLTTQPVKEWQRAPDIKRIGDIAAIFSSLDEIMPNAVLLCENLHAVPTGQVKVISANFQPVPALQEVTITTGMSSPNRALWIIDGQHRIAALASALPDEPIPVVMLLNNRAKYAPNQVAKIFAQVTTGAEPLKEEHGEWMAYAFKLKKYSDPTEGPGRQLAMATVVELCRTANLPDGTTNPFHNQVQFNPDKIHQAVPQFGNGVSGGFSFACQDLQKILFSHYFVNTAAPMAAADLAAQLAMAVQALSNVIGTPMDSVFFGEGARDVVRDAYIVGVLAYLHANSPSPCKSVLDWEELLRSLNFQPPASWVFHWARDYSGPAGTRSRKVAAAVFKSIFGRPTPALPPGVSDIPSYLKGANAEVTITLATLTPTGKGSTAKGKFLKTTVNRMYVGTIDANAGGTAKYHAQIDSGSCNVAAVDVLDDNARGNQRDITEFFESGVDLTSKWGPSGTLNLAIVLHFFGGTQIETTPTIVWK